MLSNLILDIDFNSAVGLVIYFILIKKNRGNTKA